MQRQWLYVFNDLKISQSNFNALILNESLLQVFDMLIRDGSLWPMRMLRTHKSLRTFLFMILSGVIVDSMYLNSDSMFWLFKPHKKYRKPIDSKHANSDNGANDVNGVNGVNSVYNINSNKGSHVCHHKDNCNSHISQV